MHEAVLAAQFSIRAAEERLAGELRDWLVGSGFVAAKDFSDGKPFGNRLVELQRRSLTIRVVMDRGEWAIVLAGPDRAWVPLMTWVKLIDASGLYVAAAPLALMASLLADRVDAIAALADLPDFRPTAVALAKLR